MIESWYEDYVDSIYQYIMHLVKDHHIAEDLIQETFVKAYTNTHQYKGKSSVKTWLYRIAYSTTEPVSVEEGTIYVLVDMW